MESSDTSETVPNPKVLHISRARGIRASVYIGRPLKFGNPFIIGRDGTREEVIKKYKDYINSKPNLIVDAKLELKGKHLVCHCSPLACHGDILLEIANQ